jgi:ubiquitin conjugation factor E4 B
LGRLTPRINITEETKLNADAPTAEQFLSQKITDIPHFITEIFFLNAYAHSIGLGPAMATHRHLETDITEMEAQIERITGTENWHNSPHAAIISAALERTKRQMEKTAAYEATMDAVMYDRLAQEKSLDFLGFVTNWLLRLVDERKGHPVRTLRLPLEEQVPIEWRCLPQFLFEIITDHMLYVMRLFGAGDEVLMVGFLRLWGRESVLNLLSLR